ncbi:DUF1501 domain-containing protein [Ideonella livida]|uniref:DUF1501 domain-containing protein n=1 Tax=Ideonella livida TaxID=2707176 RepID=A0A7C9PGG2_9BURK|nr:DUF1501 domain-containing protein [Ideonella livida]NDY91273.1 DUF1501 domain-containing protein [Ideonella livida]
MTQHRDKSLRAGVPASTFGAARRRFLARSGRFAALGAAAPLAMNLAVLGGASAQSAGDYKALICLFLYGGNDTFNTVLRTDGEHWDHYAEVRAAGGSLALLAPGTARSGASGTSPEALGGVLPLSALGSPAGQLALHPVMTGAQRLFNTDRRLAVLSNIGPLKVPTTKADLAVSTHPRPAKLYSHNDQQATWMALAPEGATLGWGGRLADRLVELNDEPMFTAITGSGNAVWLAGDQVRQYQIGSSGALRMGDPDSSDRIFNSTEVSAAMRRIARQSRSAHALELEHVAVSGRSIDAEAALRSALKPPENALFGTAPVSGSYRASDDPRLQYTNPTNGQPAYSSMAQRLQTVARLIEAHAASGIGARRQVFFVAADGGYDTHSNQGATQADNLARLDHALRYLDDTLGRLGMREQVTTFTASEFGRTFTTNGDGTDHGWGAHHLVMGGAVRGGRIFGELPTLGTRNASNNLFDNSPDQLANGALLPTTSVDQLGATLGRWWGVGNADLLEIFSSLSAFSSRNLGFMA